jgi:hypothetical protein
MNPFGQADSAVVFARATRHSARMHTCRVTWLPAGSLTNWARIFGGLQKRGGTWPAGSFEAIPSEEAGPTDDGKG